MSDIDSNWAEAECVLHLSADAGLFDTYACEAPAQATGKEGQKYNKCLISGSSSVRSQYIHDTLHWQRGQAESKGGKRRLVILAASRSEAIFTLPTRHFWGMRWIPVEVVSDDLKSFDMRELSLKE